MQVSVEKTSELSRKMTVSVPEEVVQEKMEERLKSLAKNVKLDGFRPGKVPVRVVKKMYGDRVRGEVTGDIIQTTYYEALQQKELIPAGQPHIHPPKDDEEFVYTAEFEIYPDVSLAGIEQIEITRPVAEVTDKDLDNMVEKLREQRKEWQEVEREAQQKDQVTLHFSGVSGGENFTNGKVEDFQVEIGAKQMIPGFEDNLVSLKAGEKKTFTVTFPEDYGNEKLAGKEAEFEIEVIKVEEPTIPEVNEEFIKDFGVESGKMEDFRADVKENMERELGQAVKTKVKNAVMDGLLEKIQVSLPNAMVDQEIDNLLKPYQEQATRQGMKLEDLQLPREDFKEQAEKRVALGLILAEIIKKNEIKADADKVRSVIDDMAKSYDQPEDVVNWYYGDKSRLTEVEQMVLEDEAVAWIVDQIKVNEEPANFDDLINTDKKDG